MKNVNGYRELIKVDKCVRCGYDEDRGSLHVHHINRDHTNNGPQNLIVLCANCHFGLHHNTWKLEDLGIHIKSDKRPRRKSIQKNKNELLKSGKQILFLESELLKKDKMIHNLSRKIELDEWKNIVLMRIMAKNNYKLSDFIDFYLHEIPLELFENINSYADLFDNKLVVQIEDSYKSSERFHMISKLQN
jgi:hypothetical protein